MESSHQPIVRMTLDEFISRSSEHKLISRLNYNVEETSVLIKVLRIDKVPGSEFLKFEFPEPIYLPIEKIYFNLQQELMVLCPPFLYIDASTDSSNSCFKVSSAYDVHCDICGNQINYINTNTAQFYCDNCFMNDTSVDEKNVIVVLAGSLAS